MIGGTKHAKGTNAMRTITMLALIFAAYLWNARRRRDSFERHMTRDEWESHLRANDPDMRREE